MSKFVEFTDFYGDVIMFNVDQIVSIRKMIDGTTIYFSNPIWDKCSYLEIALPYEEVVAKICDQSKIPTISCKE